MSKVDEPSLKEQAANPAATPRGKRLVHARPDKAPLANGQPPATASATGFRFKSKRGPSVPGHASKASGSMAAKEASAKMRPSPPAGPEAAVEGASLKLPAAAQIQIVNALLEDPEAPVAAMAVELLQSNLRWPGKLRLDPHPVAEGAA
ncbi:MAG: hypothetical protein HKL95_00575, partial [Phycisphaerae bacterium]|nr:hypothetical protein [Phycisphaerae bacterium]